MSEAATPGRMPAAKVGRMARKLAYQLLIASERFETEELAGDEEMLDERDAAMMDLTDAVRRLEDYLDWDI